MVELGPHANNQLRQLHDDHADAAGRTQEHDSVKVAVATTNVNQMVLAGAQTPYPMNSVIPYTMTLNGDTVANGSSLTNRPPAGVAGTKWPLILTLTGGLPDGQDRRHFQRHDHADHDPRDLDTWEMHSQTKSRRRSARARTDVCAQGAIALLAIFPGHHRIAVAFAAGAGPLSPGA